MADYDTNIHTNPDARAWAKLFREIYPNCNVPDDIMSGWFANAMMAMHDHLVLKGTPINGDHAQHLIDKAIIDKALIDKAIIDKANGVEQ